ncbi:hypothetical protein Bcer98_3603 [Bacillus cytotoxicus NVH 391-98]|uniref:Uncharacterized protein n=1 Tax=Bacillus cytotoxicus (strain DSM 22905 / CIP 110041 / 391-98 / NVH 391-98) TaxID=315749 RepID=A7GUJ4_BACCN|nr:hypothetical protein Bcer98_3603 [Bacillus cytotoxicus NVH 391-98]
MELFVSSHIYDKFDIKDKENRESTYGPNDSFTVVQTEIEDIRGGWIRS